jgi:transposase
MAAADKTRLDAPGLTPAVRKPLTRTVRFLSGEADRVQAEAEVLIASDPALAADRSLLESVKGVGRPTATTVLAPAEFQSGKSVRKYTRLSKAGNARLRTALYLPTLTAIRFNPVRKAFERD